MSSCIVQAVGGCMSTGLACTPCSIPKQTLYLSWNGGGGPISLPWQSSGQSTWSSTSNFSLAGQVASAQLKCTQGYTYLIISDVNGSYGACEITNQYNGGFGSGYFTCSPFHLHGLTSLGIGGWASVLNSAGITDFYVDI